MSRATSLAACLSRAAELNSDSARRDLELLLCKVLNKPRSFIFSRPEYLLTDKETEHFETLFAQRQQGLPIAHLIGERGFWDLDLKINASTLIPRPDTETLVEAALEICSEQTQKILDLGCGSGAIALALAKQLPTAQVYGVDKIEAAVALSRENQLYNGIRNCHFTQGHWFENVEAYFDVIVSNPPYIAPDDPHLNEGDLRFEPRSALVADDRGYADLEYLVDAAPAYLLSGAWLLLEHGHTQAARLRRRFAERGYTSVTTHRDLGGNERVTRGRFFA